MTPLKDAGPKFWLKKRRPQKRYTRYYLQKMGMIKREMWRRNSPGKVENERKRPHFSPCRLGSPAQSKEEKEWESWQKLSCRPCSIMHFFSQIQPFIRDTAVWVLFLCFAASHLLLQPCFLSSKLKFNVPWSLICSTALTVAHLRCTVCKMSYEQ